MEATDNGTDFARHARSRLRLPPLTFVPCLPIVALLLVFASPMRYLDTRALLVQGGQRAPLWDVASAIRPTCERPGATCPDTCTLTAILKIESVKKRADLRELHSF